jgi:hypothetical protein
MFAAQLAYDVFRKAVSLATDFLKDSVSAFIESEQATKQLETVLKSTGHAAGITKDEVLGLASALQQQTNFEDDAIVAADNLLLTFTKVGKDIFPQATEIILDMSQALGQDLKSSAIQVGKALQDPILGVTALRRVGVNFNQEQTEIIKNLVNTGRSTEAQAMILKELQTEFGGSAKAARDTFGGALKAVQNNVDDLQETFGSYIAAAGRPFVENMNEMVLGINSFLQSKEGFQQVKDVLLPLVGVFGVAWDFASKLFSVFVKFGEGVFKDLKNGFSDIVGKGNETNVVFGILGGFVKNISVGFTILQKVIKLVIQGVADLVSAIGKSIDVLGAFGEALADPLNEKKWKKVEDNFKLAGDAFAKFGAGVMQNTTQLVAATINEFKNFETEAKSNAESIKKSYDDSVKGINSSLDKLQTGLNETAGALNKPIIDEPLISDDAIVSTEEKIKAVSEYWKAAAEETKKYWDDVSNEMNSAFDKAFDAISGALKQSIDNEQTLEDNNYKKKKANIEATVTDEEEKAKQLEALEKEHAAKTAEIKKKQFEADKAANIIGTIISTARGVAEAVAMAHLFPFNFVLAGIIGAAGAVQLGTILSQPTPEFAKGTGMSKHSGLALVGEKGPELVNFGRPAQIFSNNDTRSILGGGLTQENNYYGDLNTQLDLDRVNAENARRTRRLLRAS